MQLLLEEGEAHRVRGHNGFGVLDEVAELRVAVFTQRGVQRDGLAAVLLDLDDTLGCHVEFLRELFRSRFATEVLQHLALHTGELVDDLDHVHRDTDRASLVGHRTGDRLADPPRGIGRELEALRVVELLHGADEAEVAFLDEIEEEHSAAGVALGQGHDESEVGLQQVVLRDATVVDDPLVVHRFARVRHLSAVEQVLGVHSGFDALGEVDFLGGVEQRHLADLLEVVLDGVSGRTGGDDLLGRCILFVGVGDDEATGLGHGGVLLLLLRVLRLGRLGGALLCGQSVRCRFDLLGGVDIVVGLLRLGRLLGFLGGSGLRRGLLRSSGRLRGSSRLRSGRLRGSRLGGRRLLRSSRLLRRSRLGLCGSRLSSRRLRGRCLLGSGSGRLLRGGLRRRSGLGSTGRGLAGRSLRLLRHRCGFLVDSGHVFTFRER